MRIVCNRVGIKRFSVHQLRHTMCTRCFEAGLSPKMMQEILGHSNISITLRIYTHVLDEQKQKELSSIEDYLSVV